MSNLLADKIKRSLIIIKLLLFIVLCFIANNQLAYAEMRLPSANRECASCHIMWLTEFKREDVSTLIPFEPKPVMKTGKQDVSSTDPMCFSCHDGFVLDSRSLWQEGKHAHPVGVKPSKDITIPIVEGKKLFPLNDDGKVYCGTCHTAHGVEWGQKDTAVFMRVRNDEGLLCMSCHQKKSNGTDHGNHPVNVKIQELIKSAPEKLMQAGARFAKNGGVICQSCHRPHGAPEKKILLMNNDKSQLCGECHSDRFALTKKQAAEKRTHPVNILPGDIKIPDAMIEEGVKLSTDGEIICQTCHKPHNATKKNHLLISKNEQDSLCQSCHVEQRKVLDSKHDMTLLRPESKNINQLSAEKSGPCSTCHLAHKGTGPKMWARQLVDEEEPMASLCLSCHQSEGLADKHTVGNFSHPVGADISRLEHPVELPAFSQEGVKTVKQLQGMVSCASCHDAHQWNSVDVDDKGDTDEPGDNRTRFLRMANGSDSALCKTCHDKKWNISGTKHDMRFMAPDSENSLGQTVEESGICGSCHLVHNANGPRLWARSYLQSLSANDIACTGCHNKDGLAKNKIPGEHSHPIDTEIKQLSISVTSGIWKNQSLKPDSDGEQEKSGNLESLPLYDLNGKQVITDGLVGCGSCHDPHNWSVLDYKLPDDPEDMEGDNNSSFLRIADQGKSKLCINCHQNKKSILQTKHDLTNNSEDNIETIKDSSIIDPRGNTASGICAHCHKPHNAKQNALWSRQEGDAKSPIARLCADCHKPDGLAKMKLTGKYSHPVGRKMNNKQLGSDLPIFNIEGNRTKENGYIDCSSCHNPHQWDPQNTKNKGSTVATEDGNTGNSFLRKPANNDSLLCVSCHEEKKSIINTDHDLSVTAKDEKNKLGQKRNASGVCGQCHIPHNASENQYLWAKKTGNGNDQIEKSCRSCHDAQKMAANKNPLMTKHPADINIWSTEIREQIHQQSVPDITVYDQTGKKTAFGSITCASCHNSHQWNAVDSKEGSGKNEEGNAKTSFLRADKTNNIVCVECHGQDALFRYKYFHGESSHKKHHMFR